MADTFTILNQLYLSGGKWKNYNTLWSHDGGIRLHYKGLEKDFPILIEKLTLKIYQYDGGRVNINFYITDETVKSISTNFQGDYITIKSPGEGKTATFDLTPLLNNSSIKKLVSSNQNFYIHMKASSVASFYRYTQKSNSLTAEWIYGCSSGSLSKTKILLNEKLNLTIQPVDRTYSHEIQWKIKQTNGSFVNSGDSIKLTAGSLTCEKTYYKSEYLNLNFFTSTSTSTEGQVIIETYKGGEKLGSNSINFEIILDASIAAPLGVKLILSPKVIDGQDPYGIFASSGLYIVNRSYIQWKAEGNAQGGATIVSSKIKYQGGLTGETSVSGLASSEQKGQDIDSSAKIICYLTLTDSRNFSTVVSQEIEPYIYSYPLIQIQEYFRANNNNEKDPIKGTKAIVRFKISFSSVNGKNSISTTAAFNVTKGTEGTISSSEGVYTASFLEISTSENNLIILVEDAATQTLQSYPVTIPSNFYLLHFPKGGRAMAIGSNIDSSESDILKIGWPVHFMSNTISTEPLPITNGGTGSSSQIGAIEELGLYNHFLPLTGGTLTGPLLIKTTGSDNAEKTLQITGNEISTENGLTISSDVGITFKGGDALYFKPTGSNSIYPILHGRNYSNYIPSVNYLCNTTIEITAPSSGEQFNIFYGFVSGETKKIYITIPLAKSLSNITKVDCSSFEGYIRNQGGYAAKDSWDGGNAKTDYKTYITEIKVNKNANQIEFLITGDSAWHLTNNATITFVATNLVFTLL